MNEHTDLTKLIQAAGRGDADAQERAAARVYQELKQTAQRMMRSERNVTLQPTALVNEALPGLLQDEAMGHTPDRAYFFGAAAQAMRRILVDQARRRKSLKRGGNLERQPLEQILQRYENQNLDLVALNDALSQLESLHPRQAQVVQLRWFMEFSVKEVAELLEISVSTVEQDWRTARAFLYQHLRGE